MDTGVVLLNFGEPPEPDRDVVVEYLTKIFYSNADLGNYDSQSAAREHSRELAIRRAPALLEEYDEIGGSPLNQQSLDQAEALEAELETRGHSVETYVGLQFMDPLIEDVAEQVRQDGIDHLVSLPIYPLCGPSTNVAANDELAAAIAAIDGWNPRFDPVTGWHRHPLYNRLRAENIEEFGAQIPAEFSEPETKLVFSAHGTPKHYLESGSRYDRYVEEWCETMASMLGVTDYALGFQNHENRDIPWTEPAIESLVETIAADDTVDRLVVEPVSFMHEQSETLSELDDELAETVSEAGLEFYRVPVPHDDDRFPSVMADLVEPFVAGFDPEYYGFRQCVCREDPGTMCLNAPMD